MHFAIAFQIATTLLGFADAAGAQSTLTQRLDHYLAQPRFASASFGVAIISLDNGHVLYAHDAERLFQPASTAKLFTAALALTELRVPNKIKNLLQ